MYMFYWRSIAENTIIQLYGSEVQVHTLHIVRINGKDKRFAMKNEIKIAVCDVRIKPFKYINNDTTIVHF